MRRWYGTFAVAVLVLALGISLGAQERPNIVFIAIDDQNDWIGHLGGHPLAKTPHLDALTKRGTTFLNAHCQAPLCNPSDETDTRKSEQEARRRGGRRSEVGGEE